MPTRSELTATVGKVALQLKASGFRRFRTDFNKPTEPGLVHVVGFQGNKWGGSFTVNLGVYVREVDQLFDDWWGQSKRAGVPGEGAAVKEYDCWLRARLGDIRKEGNDKWWNYGDIAGTAIDIQERLTRDALPAFTEVSSRAGLLAWWRDRSSSPYRWTISPRTPLGVALLMKQAGDGEEAQAIVDAVFRDTLGKPFHHTASVVAEEMGLAWRAT